MLANSCYSDGYVAYDKVSMPCLFAALEGHVKMVAEQLNELQKDIRVAEPLDLMNLSPGDHWIKFLETKAETLVVMPGEPTTMSMENVSTPDAIVAAPGSNVASSTGILPVVGQQSGDVDKLKIPMSGVSLLGLRQTVLYYQSGWSIGYVE